MADREQLQSFAEALGSRATWRILGRKGHVYVFDATAFLLVCHPGSAYGWTTVKKHLGFCRLTQDGDDEGCLVLDRLPDLDEASTIRHVLAIAKKRDVSPEAAAQGAERLAKFRFKPAAGAGDSDGGCENGE